MTLSSYDRLLKLKVREEHKGLWGPCYLIVWWITLFIISPVQLKLPNNFYPPCKSGNVLMKKKRVVHLFSFPCRLEVLDLDPESQSGWINWDIWRWNWRTMKHTGLDFRIWCQIIHTLTCHAECKPHSPLLLKKKMEMKLEFYFWNVSFLLRGNRFVTFMLAMDCIDVINMHASSQCLHTLYTVYHGTNRFITHTFKKQKGKLLS